MKIEIENTSVQPIIGVVMDITGNSRYTLLMEIKSDTNINPEEIKKLYGKHKLMTIEVDLNELRTK